MPSRSLEPATALAALVLVLVLGGSSCSPGDHTSRPRPAAEVRSPAPPQPEPPPASPQPPAESPPVAEQAARDLLLVYEHFGLGHPGYLGLLRDRSGVWERACDVVEAPTQLRHGDVLAGRVTRSTRPTEGQPQTERLCTIAEETRTTQEALGFTIYASPALGPFSAGMPRERIETIVGAAVPGDTEVGTHVRYGPYELQMQNDALYFVSALRSDLGALVVPGHAEIARGDRPPKPETREFEPMRERDAFRPSLSARDARTLSRLRWVVELDGGWADLRPLADDALLFVNRPRRHSYQRAHLRGALIGWWLRRAAPPPPSPPAH